VTIPGALDRFVCHDKKPALLSGAFIQTRGGTDMMTLDVIELENGQFGVQAVGEDAPYGDAGAFDTRVEAEEWIFNRAEHVSLRDDPGTLIPGSGQGPR